MRICPSGESKIIGGSKIVLFSYCEIRPTLVKALQIIFFSQHLMGVLEDSYQLTSLVIFHMYFIVRPKVEDHILLVSLRMEEESLVATGNGLKPATKNKSNVEKGDQIYFFLFCFENGHRNMT